MIKHNADMLWSRRLRMETSSDREKAHRRFLESLIPSGDVSPTNCIDLIVGHGALDPFAIELEFKEEFKEENCQKQN